MPSQTAENSTVDLILSRLPAKPLLSPRDVADAFGLTTTQTILLAIQTGKLACATIGNRFIISRTEAERYIRATAYQPDEA